MYMDMCMYMCMYMYMYASTSLFMDYAGGLWAEAINLSLRFKK